MIYKNTAALLKDVKELELIAKKNTTGLFSGNYISTILGHGMEFHEARQYVDGESIRLIDWNMTARLGDVYVKKFREEREREIFIMVDFSPSMYFGTKKQSKIEKAIELAATLGFSAITNNDKLGLACYQNQVTDFLLPKKSKSHMYLYLRTLIQNQKKFQPTKNQKHFTNLLSAIESIQNQKSRKFMIFVISDFLQSHLEEQLKVFRSYHDVVLFNIFDPFEYRFTKNVKLNFKSMEGTFKSALRFPGGQSAFEDVEDALKSSALKYNMDVVSLSTQDYVNAKLLEYFKTKQKRRPSRK